MGGPVYISVEEALEAVRAAAWREPAKPEAAVCGHPGCTDHPGEGRKMIHVLTGFGCDISLEAAEERIRGAQRCAWVESLLRHDLGVIDADGYACYFEVRRPQVVAAAGLVCAGEPGTPHDRGQK